MSLSVFFSLIFLGIFSSIFFNGLFRVIAKKYNILIDVPDRSRKFHLRKTPITGGLAIQASIIASSLLMLSFTGVTFNNNINGIPFLENELSENQITKNFIANDQDYKINLYSESDEKSIDINISEVGSPGKQNSLTITPINNDIYKVTLSNGEEKFYSIDDNIVYEVLSENTNPVIVLNSDNKRINLNNFSTGLFVFGFFVTIFLAIDDIWGIKVKIRLLFQALIAYMLILFSDIYLLDIGNIFGGGNINLGGFGVPFTIFCIVGIMNAFNMLDGLNGLCAGMTLQTLLVIFLITTLYTPAYGFLIPIGAIIGFMLYNLGLIGKKRRVFLGDNGSNLMGFLAGWIAIYVSQGENAIIEPVTALWFVFIPLIDCVTVIISRIINGVMPFRPGRDHLHHRLLDRGLNSNQILQIYIVFSIILSSIGYAIQTAFPNAIYLSFYIFLIFTLMYYVGTKLYLKNVQYI